MSTTGGVLWIHSAPSALGPHIEWAVGGVFGMPVRLGWTPQPVERTTYRAEHTWHGPVGTAARLASALRGWSRLRFEVAEEGTAGLSGVRYSATPTLGVFQAATGPHGDLYVPEERLRAAMLASAAGGPPLADAVDALLGQPWDDELEPFRRGAEDCGVRWLHEVV